ncbi:MAG: CDP-alcohol phosphatidyltransferase family protein [Mariprofundaceae bacterium]
MASHILIPVLSDADKAAALRNIAGLPLIRRVLLGARKAGFDSATVLLRGDSGQVSPVLNGTHAAVIEASAWPEMQSLVSVLILAPDFLPSQAFFDKLQEQLNPDEPQALGGHAILCAPAHLGGLLTGITQAACEKTLLAALHGGETGKGDDLGVAITNDGDRQQAEAALLAGLVKSTEGFMSRHINRKISLAVTKRLMHTNITPNHMTWVSMIIGLAGAAFFLLPEQGAHVLGAVLFLLHSILDGCDGELARLKFMESRNGGVLDFWSDNAVHVAVFASLGFGLTTQQGEAWPLWFGATAVIGTIASAWMVFNHTMRKSKRDGPLYTSVSTAADKSMIVRIADMLSRRDFIYLVLVLAIFGKLHWFLIASGIGAPIYALVLVGIVMRDARKVVDLD